MTGRTAGALQATLWIVLVVAAAAGMWLTYHVQHDKVVNLRNEVAGLQTQLKMLNKSQPTQTGSTTSTTTFTSRNGTTVVVYYPASNSKVVSPLAVVGEVPGNWSFEASFPIILKDSTGKAIAQGTATVLGDWMTDQLVPFSAKLTFTGAPSGNATLVLQKDNPSGLAKNDDSVSIPVSL